MSKKNLLKIIICFISIILLGFLTYNYIGRKFKQVDFEKPPTVKKHIYDYSRVVPSDIMERVEQEGRALQKYLDADFVMVIVPSLDGNSAAEYANRLFSNWKIGKATQGKKGILILISTKEQKIKIEVGYDLEEVYPDIYIGQVEREMLKEFLEKADWERGFLATLENFVDRAYRMGKKGVDVREISSPQYGKYYSGGAGAENVFDFGAALKKPIPKVPLELRNYFNAQPSPALAFERYMEFCVHNISDYTVDLFSENSKEFFSHWITSSGQRRAEAEASSGISYVVREKEWYAVVLFPSNDDPEEFMRHSPYFFVHAEKGWQIDINTMSRSIIMGGGGNWHFMKSIHPYMFAFEDYLIRVNRYYPLRGQKAFLGLVYFGWGKEHNGFRISPEIDSSAEKAGVMNGDILISIDGVTITKAYQDWDMMKQYRHGDVVNVSVIRNSDKRNIQVKLGEVTSYTDEYPYKKDEGDPWFGVYVGYSEPYERKVVQSYDSILYVVKGSPAEKAGLKERDLIIYNDHNQEILYSKNVKTGDRVKLKILRDLKDEIEVPITVGSYSQGKEGL